MRLLVISNVFPSAQNMSSGIFVHKLFEDSEKVFKSITVVSPRAFYKAKDIGIFDLNSNLKCYYPKYLKFPFFINNSFVQKVNNFLLLLCIRFFFKNINENFDLVYAHFCMPSGLVASYLKKKFGIKFVLSLGESVLFDNKNKTKKNSMINVIKSADKVLTVSQKIANEVSPYVNTNIIYYTPNGVDLDVFKRIDKNHARRILNLPLDKKIIAFVGSISKRKGFDKVIKCASKFEDDVVVAVASSNKAPGSEKIIFCERVDNKKLNVFLSACDCFLFPTSNEGMSNAILEAMSCSVPIVTSNLDFNREFLNHDNAFLFEVESEEDIYQKTRSALFDNKKIQSTVSSASLTIMQFSLSSRRNFIHNLLKEQVK